MKVLLSIAKFLWMVIATVIILVGVISVFVGDFRNGLIYLISGAIVFFFMRWLWSQVLQKTLEGTTSNPTQNFAANENELNQLYDDCVRGNLPVIPDPPIILKPREKAHFACPVDVRELKTETTSYRAYAGTRVKIGDIPVYLGGSAPQKISREVMKPIGNGAFVITDKRIILSGTKINYSIKLSQITDVELFSDAVQIMNEGRYGGRYYIMNEPPKAAIIILSLLAHF